MTLEITVEQLGGWSVVTVRGRLDSVSVAEFDRSMKEIVAAGTSRVLLNCAELRYVSSVGLRVFIECSQLLGASGGTLSFAAMTPHVRNVFGMVGFMGLFEVYSTVEEALETK